MALTLGYVEVPFDQRLTSLAAATRHDFAAETIYIPQVTSRTILSAWIEVTVQQNNTSVTNLTSLLMGIKLGGASFDDATQTQTFTNSGEINSWNGWCRDVTAYFVSNFGSGASQTVQVGIQVGGASSINHTAKVCVVFEYDDSDDTRIKLVKIPIESRTGDMTTSHVELGTDQVPLLDSFCPEASKTFRHIWFEFQGNDNQAGATDHQVGLRLDSGGSDDLDGTHESFANASRFYTRIWRPTVSTSATHKVYSRTTNATSGKYAHHSLVLCVSYEYSESGSSSILNSLWLPTVGSMIAASGNSAADQDRIITNIQVQEPNVSLQQSGFQLWAADDAGATIHLLCGGQSDRSYVHAAASTEQGPQVLMHRFDSGAAQGSGLTLARGRNTLQIDLYTSTAACRGNGGMVILNYTSDKAAGGSHTHNKTIPSLIADSSVGINTVGFTTAGQVAPPETDYWLTNSGCFEFIMTFVLLTDRFSASMSVRRETGDTPDVGWVDLLWFIANNMDVEIGEFGRWADTTLAWRRWPGDTRSLLMDFATSRSWSTVGSNGGKIKLVRYFTYHTITTVKSGTVSGYADADGAGLTVQLWHATDGYKVAEVTTTTGGDWTFTWYDDTATGEVIAYCFEDSSHVGAGEQV